MALTAIEVWELGVALVTGREGKIAGRWTLERGAGDTYSGYGETMRSHAGTLCLGNAAQPAKATTFEAAPRDDENTLYTLIEHCVRTYAVVIRAEQPVTWHARPPIAMTGKTTHHALWTPGMATKGLKYSFEIDGKRSVLGFSHSYQPLHWAIGCAADGTPSCVVFGFDAADLFAAVDGKTLASPTATELAEARALPHPDALPADDLAQLGVQIAREGKRALGTTKHAKASRPLKELTSKLRVSIGANATGLVPSKKGKLMLGNVDDPKHAIELALGGSSTNRKLSLRVEGAGRHRTFEWLSGVRLTDTAAVRWAIEGELSAGAVWHGFRDKEEAYDRRAVVAFWTPGVEPTEEGAGVNTLACEPNDPLVWLVGYDSHDTPTVVFVGSRRIAEHFDLGRAGLGDVAATAKAKHKATAEAEAAAAAAAALPIATATELAAIATAIAAGPKKRARLGGRFAIQWDRTAIPSVKGKLVIGDPGGATFQVKASTGPLPTFDFVDNKDQSGAGYGRTIVGVRLREGKAVKWERGGDIGVDSGRYGLWSPGFDTGDLDEGTHTKASLAAKIVQTAEGDCVFTSLVGLDARKQPVAFLFGEALHREVFAAR